MIQEVEIFLNSDDFAHPAVFTPAGGVGIECDVLFYRPGDVVTIGESEVMIDQPMAEIAESVCGRTPKKNSTLLLKDTMETFYAIGRKPDGNGFVKIDLSEEPEE